ncbi:MAG TPA: YebC/PmpR family DNA-binding transcriptional regulator [Planctomycetota bacterium]|nr:YebC/PmpR family DNA-binding transcriptional regulator [Planctomycetota bacterium]
MAGHSHAANIAVRKGKQDALRARAFAKLSKGIMVAARKGPDPDSNFALRHAIDLARAQSMPNNKIDHAIKKGAGLIEGEKMTEITYEGYGPGGVAIIVEALTDNINRTRPEIAKMFENGGGNLGAANSVMWMFKRKGLVTVKTDKIAEDALMDLVLEAGAEDLKAEGDVYEILTSVSSFEPVRKALAAKSIPTEMAELRFIPDNPTDADVPTAKKVLELVDDLDGHDDVNAVHHSLNMTDEIIAAVKEEAAKG